MLNKDMLPKRHRDRNLLDGISSRQKHTEGVRRVAGIQAAEEPGVGTGHCLPPLPGSPTRHRRCKAMHLRTMSSKGAFLLTALLESNRATPVRFWGSTPLFTSAFSVGCQTYACPPLQSNRGSSQRLDFVCFPILGARSMPWEHRHPRNTRFSVLSCSFILF